MEGGDDINGPSGASDSGAGQIGVGAAAAAANIGAGGNGDAAAIAETKQQQGLHPVLKTTTGTFADDLADDPEELAEYAIERMDASANAAGKGPGSANATPMLGLFDAQTTAGTFADDLADDPEELAEYAIGRMDASANAAGKGPGGAESITPGGAGGDATPMLGLFDAQKAAPTQKTPFSGNNANQQGKSAPGISSAASGGAGSGVGGTASIAPGGAGGGLLSTTGPFGTAAAALGQPTPFSGHNTGAPATNVLGAAGPQAAPSLGMKTAAGLFGAQFGGLGQPGPMSGAVGGGGGLGALNSPAQASYSALQAAQTGASTPFGGGAAFGGQLQQVL